MAKLRYVPDANDATALEKQLTKQIGFTFNPIAVEGLLSRWTMQEVLEAVNAVYVKGQMGCDALLFAVENYLDKVHP